MTCFAEAFKSKGLAFDENFVRLHRGKNKHDMIRLALSQAGLDVSLVAEVYNEFTTRLKNRIDDFEIRREVPGLFDFLRKHDVVIGLGTGLTRDVFDAISKGLEWDLSGVGFIGTASDVAQSRPDPEMINTMIRRFEITRRASFLKVGDTVADIEEGKNAGVKTAALLAGTQGESMLRAVSPDYLITDLAEIVNICRRHT